MFEIKWLATASRTIIEIQRKAEKALESRRIRNVRKATRDEGLFKQINKCTNQLAANPRHPGLHTHEYDAIPNPIDASQKVFEAYVQNNTPAAYRVFWCYGPNAREITIIAITPHP